MIVRIVQMTFQKEKVTHFISFFESRKHLIRNFAGCNHLELWQDTNEDNIFFTYSIWDNEYALNKYRFSEFFKDTWTITKAMFVAKPQAWSVNRKIVV